MHVSWIRTCLLRGSAPERRRPRLDLDAEHRSAHTARSGPRSSARQAPRDRIWRQICPILCPRSRQTWRSRLLRRPVLQRRRVQPASWGTRRQPNRTQFERVSQQAIQHKRGQRPGSDDRRLSRGAGPTARPEICPWRLRAAGHVTVIAATTRRRDDATTSCLLPRRTARRTDTSYAPSSDPKGGSRPLRSIRRASRSIALRTCIVQNCCRRANLPPSRTPERASIAASAGATGTAQCEDHSRTPGSFKSQAAAALAETAMGRVETKSTKLAPLPLRHTALCFLGVHFEIGHCYCASWRAPAPHIDASALWCPQKSRRRPKDFGPTILPHGAARGEAGRGSLLTRAKLNTACSRQTQPPSYGTGADPRVPRAAREQ